ncbi:MAG TPA: repressor LexA [Chloroflexi bacterium]|nr:repressor LexA [Chloroflexota bacterium]
MLMMARKRKPGLSERHRKVLDVLEGFHNTNGFPPTIREIGQMAEIPSTSLVNYYLKQLQEMGYIERESRRSRGIRLLKNAAGEVIQQVQQAAENVQRQAEAVLRIPLAGRIVASAPAPVPGSDFNYFDEESAVEVARSLLPGREKPEELYALEVQGDSMIDAMVNDGDIVIMRRANEARNGEMVAVWLADKEETTLKYFYKEGRRVRLQPANPTMQPIIIEDPRHVQIQGKVVMVIRQLERPVSRSAAPLAV